LRTGDARPAGGFTRNHPEKDDSGFDIQFIQAEIFAGVGYTLGCAPPHLAHSSTINAETDAIDK
jgi:hypothetical protein